MLNLAHRGYSSKYPENTMLAFKKAMAFGADGIEIDVQLSKDGVPMVFHDETLDRLTTFSGLLCTYDAKTLSQMTVADSDETIPTLEQVLNYFKANKIAVMYNIELKNSIIKYHQIERLVIELLRRYQVTDDAILSSFNHQSIKRIKSEYPKIKGGVLSSSYLINTVEYIKAIGAEYYHPNLYILDDSLYQPLYEAGIGINAWTGAVLTTAEYHQIEKYKLSGIITNYPEDVRQIKK